MSPTVLEEMQYDAEHSVFIRLLDVSGCVGQTPVYHEAGCCGTSN